MSEAEKTVNEEAHPENDNVKIEKEVPNVKPPTEYRTFNESMSKEVGKLAGAMAKAQGSMSNGAKDAQGYGYKYMTLGNLTDIAREHLSKNELAILQTHELVKGEQPCVVTHTTLMHSSGQWHKSSLELPITIMKQLSAAQMIGVVATYGRRYALQALCLIASEEDTDGK